MRTILSEASYAEFQSQGFVRTGLMQDWVPCNFPL